MEISSNVLIVATMDTKGNEVDFVESCLRKAGVESLILDAGIMGTCDRPVEVSREDVARAAGTTIEEVRNIGHEGKALAKMIEGAVKLATQLVDQGKVKGIIGIGGSMGTTLGTAVMRAFHVGLPKLMVTTMASRDTRSFVGTRDILMLHSVCDLSGLNRVTRAVLRNGAMAMAGMVKWGKESQWGEKPLVAMSTLGTTEACAVRLRAALETRGYEVVVFHTVGSGGSALDRLIREHDVDAVIELSLHELTDNRFGGDYDAGPDRGKAAMEKGVPTVLVPGNVDFLVTGPRAIAEKNYPGRKYHSHNSAIAVVRTSDEELEEIGRVVAGLCKGSKGAVEILVPEGGLSAFDHPNGPLHDPNGPGVFLKGLKEELNGSGVINCIPAHINDEAFSDAVMDAFDRLVQSK